jgi:hypothetical protein
MAVGTAVVAGTASAVSRRAAASQQAAAPPAAPPAAASDAGTEDSFEKLKQLGELHAQGVLTDEEFAAEKAKLLG